MVKKRTYVRLRDRLARFLRRQVRTKKARKRLLVGAAVVIVLSLVMAQKITKPFGIDATAYAPLLDLVAKGESGGNYNAYFGNAHNDTIKFTDMTLGEVLEWQTEYVAKGNVSNAVGKYQIVQPTLQEFARKLNIDTNTKFDKATQDRVAIALLERRGSVAYASNKLTREQFAANLAMEWAALPKMTGPDAHQSYYAGDGINKSSVSVDEVNTVLGIFQKTANPKL